MIFHPKLLIFLGLFGVLISFLWPFITDIFLSSCPWYSYTTSKTNMTTRKPLKTFTLAELNKHDGSNTELPIYLAIGGHVLDVTSGEKFYGKGKTYNLFAGKAATRALALSSLLEKDISDDTSDFNEEQKKELEKMIHFYLDKYPKVGDLAANGKE